MDKLPTYTVNFTEDDEQIEFISLVHDPAIEITWKAFSKELEVESNNRFKQFGSEEEQKLAGYLMVPDKLIFRRDPEIGEYNVLFTKEVIQKMADRFNRDARNNNINFEHQKDSKIDGAYVTENWIVDGEADKVEKYGFEKIDGGWFGVVKIENKDIWKEVKDGKVLGFSIEGIMGITKQNKQTMNKEIKFEMELPLADGTSIHIDAEALTLGANVFTDIEKTIVAEDGEYITPDSIAITIVKGKITKLEAKEEEVKKEEEVVEEEVLSEQALAEVETEVKAEEPIITDNSFKDEILGKFEVLAERVLALETALTTEKKINEELLSKVEAFSKLPGSKSVTLNSSLKSEPKAKQSFSDQIAILRRMSEPK